MKKNWFVNFSLLVFSTVFFLFLLETGSWLYTSVKGTLNECDEKIQNQGILPDNKQPGEKRVFVVGESAVEGIPYSPEMSFAGFLSQLVGQSSGTPPIKVINVGIKGRHSFYQREWGKTLVRYGADAVILYVGNNDTRDFSNVIRDLPLAWLDFKLTWNSYFYWQMKRRIRAFQKFLNHSLNRKIFHFNYNSDDVWHWTDEYIRKKRRYMEDPALGLKRKQRAVQDYEGNLGALVQHLKSHGVIVYISELPINHQDEPRITDLKKNLGPHGKGYEIYQKNKFSSEEEKQKWEAAFASGAQALTRGEYREALEFFKKAESVNHTFSRLSHLLGRCYEGLREFGKAREMYVRGKDLEIQSPGGDTLKNASLKRIAASTQSAWIGVQEVFESVSPNGIVGKNIFLDHCHLNLFGNKLVAARLMQSLCETKFAACPAEGEHWKFWFEKLSRHGLDPDNLAREYILIGFYLINGTAVDPQSNFEDAVYYLKKAQEMSPLTQDLYPLLAVSYWNVGDQNASGQTLLKLKELNEKKYDETLLEYSYLQKLGTAR